MPEESFNKLIDKEKYQVFVAVSPTSLPLILATHLWVIINRRGNITRFEIKHFKNKEREYGYLHINAQPPLQGLSIIYKIGKFYWKAEMLGYIEGDENSLAKKVVDLVENSKTTYPYLQQYSFVGLNSNTYVKWILNNFPEFQVRLPWNSFGKNPKIK